MYRIVQIFLSLLKNCTGSMDFVSNCTNVTDPQCICIFCSGDSAPKEEWFFTVRPTIHQISWMRPLR